MLAFLNGKKTYLLLIVYSVLVLTGLVSGDGTLPTAANIQDLVLAGALAALRAGVAKVTG